MKLRLLVGFVLLLILPATVKPDEKVTLFINDVQLDGFPAKMSRRLGVWSAAMAEEVRGCC